MEVPQAGSPGGAPDPHAGRRRLRSAVMGCGGVLAVLALAAIVGVVPLSGLPGATQWLLLAGGLTVAVLGFLGRRSREAWSSAGRILLNTIALVAGLEVCAGLAVAVMQSAAATSQLGDHDIAKLPSSSGTEWFPPFWEEHQQADQVRYEPYSVWRNRPFSGRFVNVTESGLRVTPGSGRADGPEVLVLGGSAVWGWGVPDWGTVPAYLQSLLGESMPGVRVRNLGQNGFVSTQELVELVRTLQSGSRPELVLFYDGYNDAFSAFQEGLPGVHYEVGRIAAKHDRKEAPTHRELLVGLLRKSNTFRLVASATGSRAPPGRAAAERTGADERLADATVAVYLENYRMVEALSKQYGFRFLFVWQPCILDGKKTLRPEERRMTSLSYRPEAVPFVKAVHSRIDRASKEHPRLRVMWDVFDDEPEQVWIDFVHLSPRGNERVARRIAEMIR